MLLLSVTVATAFHEKS